MYKQGDIITVKYPFSDKPQKTKLRPAIVISNKKSNSLDNDLLIAPITSTIRATLFSFPLDNKDLTKPLPKNSEIRCNKITTIRQKLVIDKISFLKKKKHKELVEKICSSIK